MNMTNDLHVVLGASGGLGNAVVQELAKQGKTVRAVNRSGKIDVPAEVEVIAADTSDPENTIKACQGAAIIYNCVNVQYMDWQETLPPIYNNIIEAAAAVNAKLVVGDNLYMYGYVAGPIKEDLPYASLERKGQLRIQLANKIMEAHKSGKIKATIGRAPDYYGPHAMNAAMAERVFIPALKGGTAMVLGNPDVKHTYIFNEDFARGLIILGEKDEALGEVWHIPSAETLTTRQFLNLVSEVAGTKLKIRSASKSLVNILGIFSPIMRELKEMMYEWENDYVVDHSKFMNAFEFETTPHTEAIRKTLDWYRTKI